MRYDRNVIAGLASELEAIRLSAFRLEREFEAELAALEPDGRESARNLLHYMALRRRDIRALQEALAPLGLSSLGRAESHVIGAIEGVLALLHRLLGRPFQPDGAGGREAGRRKLGARTEALFGAAGAPAGGRNPARIMVTMPTDAAVNYQLVRDLVQSGMTCMRINCAHDDRAAWARMIEHLQAARRETGKQCRLLMDLAGPKLRTGPIEPGPRVVHWEPERDELGRLVAPALVWLTPQEAPETPPVDVAATLPLPGAWLAGLRAGDRIRFADTRGKRRRLKVVHAAGRSWMAESREICYLSADCVLRVKRKGGAGGGAGPPGEVQAAGILPLAQFLYLLPGETLLLTGEPVTGRPVSRDHEGKLLEEPRIACTLPEALACVEPGERVWFDDGKIGGVVVSRSPGAVRVRIVHPALQGKKLRADRGINLPDSRLELPALTAKDLEDLDFIVEHADMVGLSFVNSAQDIERLQAEIARRTGRKLGVVLKIETHRGFEDLPRLLLAALRRDTVGVMIARGDLAVECGYERLAELQEEILWVCEAAHIPVIWATQVLETLNKKGLPSRAEITDAAMGERAECIMLNKGPHVVEAVRVLGDIVGRMQAHQEKKRPMLRALGIASRFAGVSPEVDAGAAAPDLRDEALAAEGDGGHDRAAGVEESADAAAADLPGEEAA